MKKQLRFLYRYLIVSKRWRRLLNRQSLIIVLATLAFLITLGLTSPSPADRETPRRPGSKSAQMSVADAAKAVAPAKAAVTANAAAPAKEVVQAAAVQATPDATLVPSPTPTHTPFPPEFEANADQTIGITLYGAMLVLIVIIGTLTVMPRKR